MPVFPAIRRDNPRPVRRKGLLSRRPIKIDHAADHGQGMVPYEESGRRARRFSGPGRGPSGPARSRKARPAVQAMAEIFVHHAFAVVLPIIENRLIVAAQPAGRIRDSVSPRCPDRRPGGRAGRRRCRRRCGRFLVEGFLLPERTGLGLENENRVGHSRAQSPGRRPAHRLGDMQTENMRPNWSPGNQTRGRAGDG